MNQVAQAYQKFVRQSPRKIRLVADTVRGLSVSAAEEVLEVTPKKAADYIAKVLTQAKANIQNSDDIDKSTLIIDSIQVEEGPRLKRWRPVSRGRAHPYVKRMSHIKITLSGKTEK